MVRKLAKLLDKLLAGSESKVTLIALNKLLNSGIPFNNPHKFKFIKLNSKESKIQAPNIRVNKNHLGGIHACATATIGEYSAGLLLIKNFGISNFRLIMKKLEVDYIKQSKEALISHAILNSEELIRINEELKNSGESEVLMSANIINQQEEVIAVVQTTWQLKNWDQVTFNK